MIYSLFIEEYAQIEIEDAYSYYLERSEKAAIGFLENLKTAYEVLKTNPYFRKRHKDVRAYKIKRYPYILFYRIDTDNNIYVISCFHASRKPKSF